MKEQKDSTVIKNQSQTCTKLKQIADQRGWGFETKPEPDCLGTLRTPVCPVHILWGPSSKTPFLKENNITTSHNGETVSDQTISHFQRRDGRPRACVVVEPNSDLIMLRKTIYHELGHGRCFKTSDRCFVQNSRSTPTFFRAYSQELHASLEPLLFFDAKTYYSVAKKTLNRFAPKSKVETRSRLRHHLVLYTALFCFEGHTGQKQRGKPYLHHFDLGARTAFADQDPHMPRLFFDMLKRKANKRIASILNTDSKDISKIY